MIIISPCPNLSDGGVLKDFPLDEAGAVYRLVAVFSHLGDARALSGFAQAIPTRGPAARELFANAQELLKEIVDKKLFTAHGVYGFFPANSDSDDIIVYADVTRTKELARLHTLRQQKDKSARQAAVGARRLSSRRATSGRVDYIGAFAVTTGHGCQELAERFEKDNDQYNSIMAKALADRLAEAFAEYLHKRARAEWGYGKDEKLSVEDLIAREISRHPPGAGLSRPARSHREADHFRFAPGRRSDRHDAHGKFRHVSRGVGLRSLLRPSRSALLRRQLDRQRSSRVLRRAQGHESLGSRALAIADPRLRSGEEVIVFFT